MNRASRIEETLVQLIGLKLLRTRNLLATRHFYFGSWESVAGQEEFMLVLECPWRIETVERILTGSEDYDLEGDDGGDAAGHDQGQKLREFMGAPAGERSNNIIARCDIVVSSVKADEFGGFRISFSGGAGLAAFPCSDHEMEWMLSTKKGQGMILMDGELKYLSRKE